MSSNTIMARRPQETSRLIIEATSTVVDVIFQKRLRVFHRGFKHEKTDESTRP